MKGVLTLLRKIISPFSNLFLDLRDKRADIFVSDQTWLAVLGGGAGAIIAVLPLIPALAGFVIHVPYLQMVLYGGLPLLGLAAILYLVSSLTQVSSGDGVILANSVTPRFRYRFSQTQRVTAKVLILPVLVVCIAELASVMPNRIARRHFVAGYVCSFAEGTPVEGSVQVLDLNGDIASKRPEFLDSHGFFVSDLQAFGFKPVALQVQASTCSTKSIDLPRTSQVRPGCLNDPYPVPQKDPTAMVLVDCGRKGGN